MPPWKPRKHSSSHTYHGLPGLVAELGLGHIPLGFRIGELLLDLLPLLLKSIRDVLEEDKAEDDVLIFRRIHVSAHLVRRLPQGLLETECCTVSVLTCLCTWHSIDAPPSWTDKDRLVACGLRLHAVEDILQLVPTLSL